MGKNIELGMISRRTASSLLGLAAALGVAVPATMLTVSDAEAQATTGGTHKTTGNVTLPPVAAPQVELPPGVHQITGAIKTMSSSTIVLSTRTGTQVTVDVTDAVRSQLVPASGNALTVIGTFKADGTLLAQSITRAKSSPALWPPDV
jgi:hypothetical protein